MRIPYLKRVLIPIVICSFVVTFNICSAQNKLEIDSLKQALDLSEGDSLRVSILGRLYSLYLSSDLDSAVFYSDQMMVIQVRNNDLKGIPKNYKTIGNAYFQLKGNYAKAMKYYLKCLEMAEQIGDKEMQAGAYNNMGMVHNHQGNKEKVLEYYEKSRSLRRELGDSNGVAASYFNSGHVFLERGNRD
ncbi:MAG: tetratricopeptide repeat protein, partial [Bacteroidetes bacterium]|nr:tetratricopeptide repeat protein [Bacteroidota bacterium]